VTIAHRRRLPSKFGQFVLTETFWLAVRVIRREFPLAPSEVGFNALLVHPPQSLFRPVAFGEVHG
jgi:hypothetical protein